MSPAESLRRQRPAAQAKLLAARGDFGARLGVQFVQDALNVVLGRLLGSSRALTS
jgi:hypothetical protein